MQATETIELKCPVCERVFRSTRYTGRIPEAMRTDFHLGPPAVVSLGVHQCWRCGYAATGGPGWGEEEVEEELRMLVRTHLWPLVSPPASVGGDDPASAATPQDSDSERHAERRVRGLGVIGAPGVPGRSGVTGEIGGGVHCRRRRRRAPGSERYEAAAKIALWRQQPAARVAYLYLCAAWCALEEDDHEAERFYRRHAAGWYERALAGDEDEGIRPDERAKATYLVGELWRRIGDDRQAARWFTRVADEVVDVDAQQGLVELAAQQQHAPEEWLR